MQITCVIVYKQQEGYIWLVRRTHLSWAEENEITLVYDSESVFWGAWFCFHCILLKRLWDQDRSLVLAEILNSQLFSSAHMFNSQNWNSARILRVCKHEFRALTTPNLYRVRNYHLLICQYCHYDAVRSEIHDVSVWWRHATMTRSKKPVRNCLFTAKCSHKHSCFIWQLIFEIIMDLTYHHRDQLLSKYAISIFLPSLIAKEEPLLESMRKIVPKIPTFQIKNKSDGEYTEGTDLVIVD